MKVLHIIDTLGPGGAQILLKDIFEIQEHNTDISLYSLRKTATINAIGHKNIRIYPSKFKYSFSPLFKLKKFIKTEKIDSLHCHLFRSQIFGYLLKRFFFPKIKLIFHEHGQILGSETLNKVEDKLFIRFLRFSEKKVNIFIAVSGFVKKSLIQKASIEASKIKILYNSINLKQFSSDEAKTNFKNLSKINETDFVIGFAGRMIEGKGWKDLLNSLQYLKSKQIKLLFAGEGSDSDYLKGKIKSLGLIKTVSYLGYIKDIRRDFFEHINCLVIPSHKEALGIVALEAFACRIPVIASNIEGLNEIVKHNHNGLLFNVKDEKDLAEKIDTLYNNKDLKDKLMSQAFLDVQEYNIDKYIENLDRIYNEL